MVDACIGADETVMSFGDEDAIAADDAPGFFQNDFNYARIFFLLRGDGERLGRRCYGFQTNERAFGLRNNFLRYDNDVAVFERDSRFMGGIANALGQIFAAPNLGDSRNSK